MVRDRRLDGMPDSAYGCDNGLRGEGVLTGVGCFTRRLTAPIEAHDLKDQIKKLSNQNEKRRFY